MSEISLSAPVTELKYVIQNKEPFSRDRFRGGRPDPDYNFITDFLDQFKILDKLDEDLAGIRKREGGNFQ